MNPETALNLVSALMDKRKESISGKWSVVFRHGNFMVLPVELTEPAEFEFGRYTARDLTEGLSIKQWNKLKIEIAIYFAEKGIS